MAKLKDTRPCKKCDGEMKKGIALLQTWTAGMPDFIGDEPGGKGCTMSPGGPGKVVEVLKCSECGWSYMEGKMDDEPFDSTEEFDPMKWQHMQEDQKFMNTCDGIVKEGEELKELKSLTRDLFELLDYEEENMNGNLFHPTFISSCRIMHTEKLGKILPRMKELSKED